MSNLFPLWADWDDPRAGRHVTCGEIPYRVIAGASTDPDRLLVIHPRCEPLWINMNGSNWRFVDILDEIALS